MTNESKIKLLISKSRLYKDGFTKATAKGDSEAAKKWKDGYQLIREKIYELKED